ncbi:hypothetical protein EV702DRAFT_407466 [Suillus placidus]|uniref:Uncharacterized protein n=1 Tax=Suillus placidus TaxID=48579 RepID=A0A9P6ZTH5_9AGAM|nr:hypothetical protein EV702DRAFT_407466 [Suillus placidus]
MQKSTASPSTAGQSTDNGYVASQLNIAKKMAAEPYTLDCGRAGCPVVFVYDVGTDWDTVSCLVNHHSLVCKGGLYGLAHSPPRSDTHGAQHAPSPPQPAAPVNFGGNHNDEVIAGAQRRNDDERKQDLEDDEYTEDVQPTSVRCCGCHKVISLDKRRRYYPGLWDKHRGKCPGILKIERDKELTSRRDPSNPPPAASSFDASSEDLDEGESDEDEDEVIGFNSKSVLDGKYYDSPRTLASNVRFFHDY